MPEDKRVREILEAYRYGINPCGYPIGGEAFNKLEKSHTDQVLAQIREVVKGLKKTINPGEHGEPPYDSECLECGGKGFDDDRAWNAAIQAVLEVLE